VYDDETNKVGCCMCFPQVVGNMYYK